jgi:hypothetical protein
MEFQTMDEPLIPHRTIYFAEVFPFIVPGAFEHKQRKRRSRANCGSKTHPS